MFDAFHCTFLRNFDNSFPVMYKSCRKKNNDWITVGIRTTCKHKGSRCVLNRNTEHSLVKHCYSRYFAILKKVPYFLAYKMHPDFFVRNFRKNSDECILILVIYWKKTGLLHTKISNHNIIYLS
jgi:hypothetical protein